MTRTTATLPAINRAIQAHGVELVKGQGYFYFSDLTDDFLADLIPSVYSKHIRCMSLGDWVAHVKTALQD